MFVSDITAEISGRQIHSTYLADSDAYRMMYQALKDQRRIRQSQRSARQSQYPARQSQRQAPDDLGCRLIERIGARLIALGRVLCERRGALAVEIAFHAGPGTSDHRPNGRHVA